MFNFLAHVNFYLFIFKSATACVKPRECIGKSLSLWYLFILCSSRFYIMPVQNLPFIENMEKRIQSASLLLDAILGHCFTDGLEHRDANAIYNCLRAYAAIDNTRSAEEIFRTTIVAPLIQKIIPHETSAVVARSSTDELENDYLQIKQCIDKDCKFLLEISSTGIAIRLLM